jgi:hypothetical protein
LGKCVSVKISPPTHKKNVVATEQRLATPLLPKRARSHHCAMRAFGHSAQNITSGDRVRVARCPHAITIILHHATHTDVGTRHLSQCNERQRYSLLRVHLDTAGETGAGARPSRMRSSPLAPSRRSPRSWAYSYEGVSHEPPVPPRACRSAFSAPQLDSFATRRPCPQ